MKCLPIRLALAALLFFIPGTLTANPVSDPTAGLAKGIGMAVVVFALAAEVALTSTVAIWLCRIGHRPPLVIAFALLNGLSYTVFIRMIYPRTGMIVLIELLIWIVEAFGMLVITDRLSDKPLTPKRALAISFAGNLLSFLIGYGV
ncbi:hypothetical protein OKA05_24865 [Luteolibacter arcticus]|uniref:Uncharacterized protein n=1 Tax=Luteolibacter arcticus TaxID=1581411 RepID=A0ABT3GQL2_9BACT|nr:hypothetical protein [Luteolibacter arcticus]MCW1925814.1 hypothetical protein [Luteolibacter arcticus]